jgi:hypothetical protein
MILEGTPFLLLQKLKPPNFESTGGVPHMRDHHANGPDNFQKKKKKMT